MSSVKAIKQRIKSVKNTSQITKAMEVVSATKMRKAQQFALSARPYAVASLEIAENLLSHTPAKLIPPLFTQREVHPHTSQDQNTDASSSVHGGVGVKKSCLLVVTSDKGLAGAFNANVLKKADAWLSAKPQTNADINADQRGHKNILITVGKKAKDYFEKRGISPTKSFWGYGDYSTMAETREVADMLIAGFQDGSWDEVQTVYMNFRTTLMQEAVVKKILPATKESIREAVAGILPEKGRFAPTPTTYNLQPTTFSYDYKFEPSPAEILESLVSQLIRMHIHHIILESNASEHSSRIVAMKSASDNAQDLITDLTLTYNNARQANITRELTEITAGKEALES